MAELTELFPEPTDIDQELSGNIEILEDGSVLIGEEEIEETNELSEHFEENLSSDIDPELVVTILDNLKSDYDIDKSSRDDWISTYEDGLKSIVGDDAETEGRDIRQLTEVIHPMLAEAAVEFQAKAIVELFPASGPVGTNIVGEADEEKQEQATRVSTFMNYQLTEEMEEYFPDLDQMLFHLPLVGHTFKKSYYDPILKRITSRFVHADQMVVDCNAVDLASAERYTHEIMISRHDFNIHVEEGYYNSVMEGSLSEDTSVVKDIEGIDPASVALSDDGPVILLEAHVYLDIGEGLRPYVVTYCYDTDELASVRRNWDPDDETHKKQTWFTSYKFLPGLEFWGFGLYHIIGGLGKAATGALRSLLDAATFSNMQGGFKLRGRVRGGEVPIVPGEFADLDAAVDDINKAIMPLPFKEPSQTMMQLLQFLVETGKRFANTADMKMSDANQNTPVGTTMALLEENGRVFSAIHKRLHVAQRKEFKIIARLNGIYLPNRYPFAVKGDEVYVLRSDFDSRVDVVPVSDPSTFSSTQRISQAQAMLQMSREAPDIHNKFMAYKRMYEALRVPNFEEVLIDPMDIPRRDAVAENVAIMHGKPVKTFEDQDHQAHMKVLDDWFNRLDPPAQQMYMSPYASHRAEHMALSYRAQIQAQLNSQLPALPDFSDPRTDKKSIDPVVDAQISQAAAVMISQNPQGPMGPPLQMPDPKAQEAAQDPLAAARMLAEAEAMSIQAKTQADIQSKQAKAQSDLQIAQMRAQFDMQSKQQQMQLDMQMQQIKLQADADQERMKAQLEAETDREKNDAEIRQMWAKAEADIQIAQEKASASLQAKQMELSVKIQLEEAKAANTMEVDTMKAQGQMQLELNDGG